MLVIMALRLSRTRASRNWTFVCALKGNAHPSQVVSFAKVSSESQNSRKYQVLQAKTKYGSTDGFSSGEGDNGWIYRGCLSFGLVSVGFVLYIEYKKSATLCEDSVTEVSPESRRDDLPNFRKHQIAKHSREVDRVWVTYNEGVYDITDYIAVHPGGDNIKLASGGALEPYWEMYAVHKGADVYRVLEGLRIGNVHPDDLAGHKKAVADALLSLHDDTEHVVEVGGVGIATPISLHVDDLRQNFRHHEISAVIKCSSQMAQKGSQTVAAGVQQDVHADPLKKNDVRSQVTWTGVKLTDILHFAKVDKTNVDHVIFQSTDTNLRGDPFMTSVPVQQAFDPHQEIILAFLMDGKTIPVAHGYPLRLVIPGAKASKQVKRVSKIILK